MYGFPLTLLIALSFGTVVGILSYVFYFKKIFAINPIKKAVLLGAVAAALTILIGVITD